MKSHTSFHEMVDSKKELNKIKLWFMDHTSLFGYNGWFFITHPHKLVTVSIKQTKSYVISFVQRGRRGYSDADIWNFDAYLAEVVSKGLRQLSRDTMAHPTTLTPEEWEEVLEEIATGFEEWRRLADSWTTPTPEQQEAWERTLRLFGRWFNGFWW